MRFICVNVFRWFVFVLCVETLNSSHESEICSSIVTTCKRGHWPFTQTCLYNELDLRFDISTSRFVTTHSVAEEFANAWNIATAAEDSSSHCTLTIPNTVFIPVLYDETHYESQGSNYYVIHVDVMLPLWNLLQQHSSPLKMIAFPFNYTNRANFTAISFDRNDAYWLQSLQLLNVSLLGTISSLTSYLQSQTSTVGDICFQHVRFGLPLFESPSKKAVRAYASYIKERAMQAVGLPHVNQTCSYNILRIGLVFRRNRRRFLNGPSLVTALHDAGTRWCTETSQCSRYYPMAIIYAGEDVAVEEVYFGEQGSVAEDIVQVSRMHILIGIQGSGMINALYMPSTSAVAVIYLNDGWPLSSGDPLSLIKKRGPYLRYVNSNASRVHCNDGDQRCDSGDLDMDEDVMVELLRQALHAHTEECKVPK